MKPVLMKIATYNVNGVNGRLPVLLRWLATSKPITKYFEKELKPGDKMDLYLISIGAYRSNDEIDCVLLVEEFQKRPGQ